MPRNIDPSELFSRGAGFSHKTSELCKHLEIVLHAPHTNVATQRQHSASTAGLCQHVSAEVP